MNGFNHNVFLWIALWAIIQIVVVIVLVWIMSKIAGKLSCKMFATADVISAIMALVVAIHFWAEKTGGWMFFGLAIGLIAGSIIVLYVYPKPEDWESCIDY